jgi:hypothetical protein
MITKRSDEFSSFKKLTIIFCWMIVDKDRYYFYKSCIDRGLYFNYAFELAFNNY